jgi:membrane peptidoglycan carboxypeptidase
MSAQNQKASGVIGAIGGMLGLSALAGVLVTVMVTPALAVTGIAASNTIGIFEGLPEYIKINEQSQRNVLWAQDTSDPAAGYTAIATVYAENREEVPWDAVSQYIKDATLAGEDRRFYDHNGVDIQSIIRAGLGNLTSGGIESGASTLTMQLVKNIFITEALKADTIEDRDDLIAQAQEQSLERKLKEAKLAIGLEKNYTKDEILLAYLNIAGFGGNTYGIQAAAQQYFGVPASDVTIAQAASLIAIVQQPGARSLGTPDNYEANQGRRDVILDSMLAEGFITQAEHREAINIPVDEEFVTLTPPQSGCYAANSYAKFFCDYVLKSIGDFETLGDTVEEREAAWKLGGYDVYTTLNLSLQQVTQDRLSEVVPSSDSRLDIGSVATSIETGTGRVITMAQNKVFDDRSVEFGGGLEGTTAVNYATDRDYGGSSGFQVGSTYKVFALVQWLNEGRGLNEVVDATVRERNLASFVDTCEDGGGPWGGKWNPKNDAAAAPAMSIFNATVQSVNTAFASVAEQLDQCAIRGAAESLGVHRADGGTMQTNPSAVLGTNEIAPLTMANAFATIANGGIFCEPIIVDRFVDRDGNELPGQQTECRRAISAEVAAAAAAPMQAVITSGTATASRTGDGIPLIAKTGTTDSSNQTWVVGSSTRVSTAVWVGNVVGKVPIRSYPSGGQLRHQIFRVAQGAINAQYGGDSFGSPPARLLTGSGVTLPDVAGQTVEQAKALLEGLGFRFELGGQVDSDLALGLVVSASPEPGTLLARGTTVTVTTSLGNLIALPDVVTAATDYVTAETTLADAGFVIVSEACRELLPGDDPLLDGIVTEQNPAGGSKIKYETAITLTVSRLVCP